MYAYRIAGKRTEKVEERERRKEEAAGHKTSLED